MQTFLPVFFIPTVLSGTIESYHFIPFSKTLTLGGGHMVSTKQKKPSWLHFLSYLQLIRMKLDKVLKQFKLNILILLLNEMYCNQGNNCCFTEKRWHAFGCLWIDLVQTRYDDRYYWTLNFSTGLNDLDLDSWSQKCEKAKTSVPVISQFWWNLIYCWDLLVLWTPHTHFVSSIQYSRGENCTLAIFFFFFFKVGLYSDLNWPIAFKLYMIIVPTKLYILMSG